MNGQAMSVRLTQDVARALPRHRRLLNVVEQPTLDQVGSETDLPP
jgi:hypothetical protein